VYIVLSCSDYLIAAHPATYPAARGQGRYLSGTLYGLFQDLSISRSTPDVFSRVSRLEFTTENRQDRHSYFLPEKDAELMRERKTALPALFFVERRAGSVTDSGRALLTRGLQAGTSCHVTTIILYQFQPLLHCHTKIKGAVHQYTDCFTSFHCSLSIFFSSGRTSS